VQASLGDTYEQIRHLGGGEFSSVYLVKHRTDGTVRALKILDYHYLLQRLRKQNLTDTRSKFDEIKRRFIVEARLYEKIDHPNIVKIHGTGVITDPVEQLEIPYFIMSYIKGSSLAEIISLQAPLEVGRAIEISRNVLGALDAMHRCNVIHRDIKASNIMIREDSGEAVIIDFGIAKDIVSGTKLTTTGALLGSPAYMAPEQFIDSSMVGPALDIYSFGVVMFEMLTGEAPFSGSNFIEVMNAHRRKPVPEARALNPSLPPGTDHILTKAMAKEPENCYKSAVEMMDALAHIHVVPPLLPPVNVSGASKRTLFIIAVLAVAMAVVILFVLNPFSAPPKKPVLIETPTAAELAGDSNRQTATDSQDPGQSKRDPDQTLQTKEQMLKPTPEETPVETSEQPAEQTPAQVAQLEFERYINRAGKAIADGDLERADSLLIGAKKVKPEGSDELVRLTGLLQTKKEALEKQHGLLKFDEIKNAVTLALYLQFKLSYPTSRYLGELENLLNAADPNLPPLNYWHLPIQKNRRGYYEYMFAEPHNNHLMIFIPGRNIWVDKYEVSNSHYRRFLKATNAAGLNKSGSKIISDDDHYPAVVTYADAQKYCAYYGFRLPRLNEWEYTAGKGKFNYPWGNEPPAEKGIWRANFDTLDDTAEQDGFDGTAPVTQFEQFSSPFGAVNMAGNVWEWVNGSILKGGSFFSAQEDLMIKKNRGGRDKDEEGFRCVKVEDENL